MRGDLVQTSLADLCRGLADAGSTGTLQITSDQGEGSVAFRGGAIVMATSPAPGARLGDRLVNGGLLTQDALDEVLQHQTESDERTKLGALLVEKELVSQDAIRVFVQEQILDALFELMGWETGSYELQHETVEEDKLPVELPVSHALMDVSRRQSEWYQIQAHIPHLGMVPDHVSGGSTAAISLEPDEFAMLASIDGNRSIRALAADLGYSEFEAARVVHGLILLGIVEVSEPPEEPAEDALEVDLDLEGEGGITFDVDGQTADTELQAALADEEAGGDDAGLHVELHVDDELQPSAQDRLAESLLAGAREASEEAARESAATEEAAEETSTEHGPAPEAEPAGKPAAEVELTVDAEPAEETAEGELAEPLSAEEPAAGTTDADGWWDEPIVDQATDALPDTEWSSAEATSPASTQPNAVEEDSSAFGAAAHSGADEPEVWVGIITEDDLEEVAEAPTETAPTPATSSSEMGAVFAPATSGTGPTEPEPEPSTPEAEPPEAASEAEESAPALQADLPEEPAAEEPAAAAEAEPEQVEAHPAEAEPAEAEPAPPTAEEPDERPRSPAAELSALLQSLDEGSDQPAASTEPEPEAESTEPEPEAAEAEEPVPGPGAAEPESEPAPERTPRRGGDSGDVSEFLRELSRLALSDEEADSTASPPPPSSRPSNRPEKPKKEPPSDEDSDKKKKRGLFGWGG